MYHDENYIYFIVILARGNCKVVYTSFFFFTMFLQILYYNFTNIYGC